MKSREEFVAGRKCGIGGSDVAAVLGLSPWKTPLDVWNDKLGLSEEKEPSEAAYWGTTLEETVSKEFQLRTGMKIQRVNHQFADKDNPWMIANIDRAIVNHDIAGRVWPCIKQSDLEKYNGRPLTTDIAFEAKTANAFVADLWGPSQELEIKQNNLKTEHTIPLYYETQIQWYCGILKLRGMYLAVLIGGSDFRMYWVDARPDVFQAIKEKCTNFWRNNVLTKTPPEPINIDDVLKLYRKSNGQSMEAEGDLAVDYGEFSRLAGEIKELKKQQEAVKAKIAIAMKDNEILTLGGKKVLTYKTQSRNIFDTEKFKKDSIDEYYQYLKTSSTRVMRECA